MMTKVLLAFLLFLLLGDILGGQLSVGCSILALLKLELGVDFEWGFRFSRQRRLHLTLFYNSLQDNWILRVVLLFPLEFMVKLGIWRWLDILVKVVVCWAEQVLLFAWSIVCWLFFTWFLIFCSLVCTSFDTIHFWTTALTLYLLSSSLLTLLHIWSIFVFSYISAHSAPVSLNCTASWYCSNTDTVRRGISLKSIGITASIILLICSV